tara:strand:+ start:70 stop:414 length:345 start_codon:yes stop_codon:yes gene_type:complete
MKKILAACAIIGATASFANAEGLSTSALKPYAGAEYKTEAEQSKLYLGSSLSLGMIDMKVQANMLDTKTDSWSYSGMDLDLSTGIRDGMTLYLNTDINDDWNRTETTLGIKLSF